MNTLQNETKVNDLRTGQREIPLFSEQQNYLSISVQCPSIYNCKEAVIPKLSLYFTISSALQFPLQVHRSPQGPHVQTDKAA